MLFGIITLLTALAMAGTAAVFAIFGIVAIFSGLPIHALVMGSVIELGKVVGVSWIYRNWTEPTKIKYAMLPLVLIAMLLTSMGIFGLLSKAHIEQTAPVTNNTAQIERLDQRINREEARIADAETVIAQLDETVQTLIEYDKISGDDGARAVREGQQEQRDLLATTIDEAQNRIDQYEDEKLQLGNELRSLEMEVGPIKYIAEIVYGNSEDNLEDAVRWAIIAFIFVFDPMAILLLMAANYSLMNRASKKKSPPTKTDPPPSSKGPSTDVESTDEEIIQDLQMPSETATMKQVKINPNSTAELVTKPKAPDRHRLSATDNRG